MFHKKQPQTVIIGENKSAKPLASLEGLVLNIAMNHRTACPKLSISRKLLLFNGKEVEDGGGEVKCFTL